MKLKMKNIFFLLLICTVCSCTKVTNNDLAKLSGYWEIKTAILPDGSKKEYTINPTIDFFELKGKEGFRKKVMPQLDGSYRAGDAYEKISITVEGDKAYINYSTQYAKWKEEILELTDEELVLKNNHDMEYHYKKPQPFSVK
jgi:hypothetical protein